MSPGIECTGKPERVMSSQTLPQSCQRTHESNSMRHALGGLNRIEVAALPVKNIKIVSRQMALVPL